MINYNVKDFASTALSNTLNSGSTSMYVHNLAQFLEPPALCLIANSRSLRDLTLGELIEITDVDVDHYIVVRSKAVTHPAGTLVLGNLFAKHYQQIYENQERLSTIIARSFGVHGYGIVRTNTDINADADFEVVPDLEEPGFNFKVMPGYGFIRKPDLTGKYLYTSLPIEIGTEQVFENELLPDNVYTVYIDEYSEIHIIDELKDVKDPAGVNDLTLANVALAQITIPAGTAAWGDTGVVINDKRFFF